MKTKTYVIIKQYLGESMKKGANRAKVKVLSKDYISMWQFSIGLYYIISRNVLN